MEITAIAFAAAIRDELAKDAESVVINEPNYHYEAMGCGIEDRGITDRYEAMRYGWDRAVERMFEQIPDEPLYTCPPSAAARIAELEEELSAEKESCKLAHDDALHQVEHLGRSEAMISELESERDALRKEVAEKNADIERLYKVIDANWISQKQIVISQLLVKQLREKLTRIAEPVEGDALPWDIAADAIALPQDTTALEAMITKAGEVMRGRVLNVTPLPHWDNIRALSAIILDDLKGGEA